jgi:hypothetical protein
MINGTVNDAVITDSSGSLNLAVTGSTCSNDNTTGDNDNGLEIDADSSTDATVNVTGSAFTNNPGADFEFLTNTASGANRVTFSDNTLNGGGGAVVDQAIRAHGALPSGEGGQR